MVRQNALKIRSWADVFRLESGVTTEGWTSLPFYYDKFNDWGGRGCNIFVPVLGGNGTKIAPSGDMFDQPPGQMQ